ncbi:hypothetical protein ACVMIX_007361 [Rhizobium leguminosarum]
MLEPNCLLKPTKLIKKLIDFVALEETEGYQFLRKISEELTF